MDADGLRVLVVSACSGNKDEGGGLREARDRYTGQAHVRIRDAIDGWRAAGEANLKWSIVSPKFGLLNERDQIPNYDLDFPAGPQARERGRELKLPDMLDERLASVDVAVVVLPLKYLHAVHAPFSRPGTQVFFAAPSFKPASASAVVVHCGEPQALALGESKFVVGAARFERFVRAAIEDGLPSALAAAASGPAL